MMLHDLIQERKKQRNHFIEAGIDPYPARVRRTHTTLDALDSFNALSRSKKKIFIVGRIVGIRFQGGVGFLDIKDGFGVLQVVVKRDLVKKRVFDLYRDNLSIGDFVQCGGVLFRTKRGEKSVEVTMLNLLVKSIRPLPDQWSGLVDMDTRLRQRYLDILMHSEVRELFIKKNVFWQTTRDILHSSDFIEMETGVLESIPGGAEALPFKTHHEALNTDFYLRISLELPLKKLLVAGFEKTFEIGRVFRNEGIDAEHLQDYTQCEFYLAYADYEQLMVFVEKMYKQIIKKTTGKLTTTWRDHTISWGKKWPRLDYYSLFKKYVGIDLHDVTEKQLKDRAKQDKIVLQKGVGWGRLVDALYKKNVRPHILQPSFLINPPVTLDPLAKRLSPDSEQVARMQVVACGTELGKGFSELNDPLDQRQRFEQQMQLRQKGDSEAQMLDEDFLQALEYGMPPAAGFGFSERFFSVLMDKPVRETTLFPLMKRSKKIK